MIEETPLYSAAKYMCLNLYDDNYKDSYVLDMHSHADATQVYYIIQGLSVGLTSICFGLLSNYLYDKAKLKLSDEDKSLKGLIEQQSKQIKELEEIIKTGKSSFPFHDALECEIEEEDRDLLVFHQKSLLKIQENDPEIQAMVQEAIDTLESVGELGIQSKIFEHMDESGS